MPAPQLIPVSSSNVAAMGHDGSDLYVRFHNGTTWKYEAVSPAVYDEMRSSGSVGSYLHKFIKPNHRGTKFEDPGPQAA